jgi:type I restriction enzyme R subunit
MCTRTGVLWCYIRILDDELDLSANVDTVADITLAITAIIESNNSVDWQNNIDTHNKIAQQIDDLFYEYEQNKGLHIGFEAIDKIIENVKTVALRRFR